MRYPLAALAVDEEALASIQTKIIPAILQNLHINRNLPTSIRLGPTLLGGVELYNVRTEAGIKAIKQVYAQRCLLTIESRQTHLDQRPIFPNGSRHPPTYTRQPRHSHSVFDAHLDHINPPIPPPPQSHHHPDGHIQDLAKRQKRPSHHEPRTPHPVKRRTTTRHQSCPPTSPGTRTSRHHRSTAPQRYLPKHSGWQTKP